MTLKEKSKGEVVKVCVVTQAKGHMGMVGGANGELNHPNAVGCVLMSLAKRRQ